MQNTLFDPTEEDLYQLALAVPLNEKIESAIKLIQIFENQALELSETGYFVCFSGGKDSIVLAKLFEMAGVKYTLNYNNTTIDPPELVRFIKKYYPQAIWHNVGKHLLTMLSERTDGPPTRLHRWCCEVYKEQGNNDKFKAIGVRAEESSRRKKVWKQITPHRKTHKPIMCPIVYWTQANIWEFIHLYNMPYCSLYDEGYKRLGCVGCPLAGPKGQKRDFARYPTYEKLWKRSFQNYWNRYKGTLRKNGLPRAIEKFDSVEDYWNWWVSGKKHEQKDKDCQLQSLGY